MAKLIHSTIMSLDGYIADDDGGFGWAMPDDETLDHINQRMHGIGTQLYGRVLYDMMTGWETDPSLAEQSRYMRDFATSWQASDKIVYSSTLTEPITARTRIERTFDPAAVQALKDAASADLCIGGSNLSAQAFKAGLVDECDIYLAPAVVGSGKTGLPRDTFVNLELLDQCRFGGGIAYLRYRVRHA